MGATIDHDLASVIYTMPSPSPFLSEKSYRTLSIVLSSREGESSK